MRGSYKIAKYTEVILKVFFLRTTGPVLPNLAQSILGWKGHKVLKKNRAFNSQEGNYGFFVPNQRYDITKASLKRVYWFELVYQVSNMAHGPLV